MNDMPRAFMRVASMAAVALAVAYLIEYDWTRAVVCILGALILEFVAEDE